VFLPVTSKTTIGELKQGFVEAMAATKSRCSAAADAIQIYRAAHPSAAASSVSRPPGSSHTDPTTSTSPAWIPLPDPLRTLSDLAIVEAQTLGIGFQNEKGASLSHTFPPLYLVLSMLPVF
jgi:hypothetical protein